MATDTDELGVLWLVKSHPEGTVLTTPGFVLIKRPRPHDRVVRWMGFDGTVHNTKAGWSDESITQTLIHYMGGKTWAFS